VAGYFRHLSLKAKQLATFSLLYGEWAFHPLTDKEDDFQIAQNPVCRFDTPARGSGILPTAVN
jgi:hypothetical protein